MKWKHYNPKSMGYRKNISKREVYSNKAYLRKQEKSQLPKLTPNGTIIRRTNKIQN